MTRQEEIIKYSQSFIGKDIENEELKDIIRLAILDGAIWADKTITDRAIKFFWSKAKHSMIEENINEFIDEFCKAMEE